MFKNYYVLKSGEYYLSYLFYDLEGHLNNYEISKEYQKLYSDIDKAEEERKIIFIETGLNLEIRKFKEVE